MTNINFENAVKIWKETLTQCIKHDFDFEKGVAYMSLRFCMETGEYYDQCNAFKMIEISNNYINKIQELKTI